MYILFVNVVCYIAMLCKILRVIYEVEANFSVYCNLLLSPRVFRVA